MPNRKVTIAAFYRFRRLADPASLRLPLLAALKGLGAKGSVLLAEEGVNGTLATPRENIDDVIAAVITHCGLPELDCKYSYADVMPFLRLKVRLKKEIVTIGNVRADPNERVGCYVEPEQWNALISDPDVIVIDTRNTYEHRIGTFDRAIDPCTESFGQFPAWSRQQLGDAKGKKIALFCTGGIRCEKATSFLLYEGFQEVYHLKGGILNYLEKIPPEKSLWRGDCYVFDERVAVGHGLVPSDITTCHGCLMPVTAEERRSPKYEEGVCCPACADTLTERQKSSNRERQKQFELAQKRGDKHLGPREG